MFCLLMKKPKTHGTSHHNNEGSQPTAGNVDLGFVFSNMKSDTFLQQEAGVSPSQNTHREIFASLLASPENPEQGRFSQQIQPGIFPLTCMFVVVFAISTTWHLLIFQSRMAKIHGFLNKETGSLILCWSRQANQPAGAASYTGKAAVRYC